MSGGEPPGTRSFRIPGSAFPFSRSCLFLEETGFLLLRPNLTVLRLRLVYTLPELIRIPRSRTPCKILSYSFSSPAAPISMRLPTAHLEQSLFNVNLITVQSDFLCCALFRTRESTLKICLNASKSRMPVY